MRGMCHGLVIANMELETARTSILTSSAITGTISSDDDKSERKNEENSLIKICHLSFN
jgi:hypothetical protein